MTRLGEETTLQTDPYANIRAWFDAFVDQEDRFGGATRGYHALVERICRARVPRGATVLEIGSGNGDLLAALEPSRGVGVDVSPRMVEHAQRRHPELDFVCVTGEDLDLGERFDWIVMSDLLPYVADLQRLLEAVRAHCHPRTRVLLGSYSQAWRPLLTVAARVGLRPNRPIRNWVAPRDVSNLLVLAGIEPVAERAEILLPLEAGALSRLLNGILVRLPGLRALAFTFWVIGRPERSPLPESGVSVVVPCRNEAGNIPGIVRRVPEMGTGTEIVFVEGGSTDETRATIERAIHESDRDMRLVAQSGKGKGNAVAEGFDAARHDLLMILDADLTVAPEDLPKFYEALARGTGELINGSRLVYGMDAGAMRFLNLLGNKAFGWLVSFILGQYVKDTLCGTKALHRAHWEDIQEVSRELGQQDPWGDYNLLFGASLLGLQIVNVPVRYSARRYGDTNMQRFSHGGTLAGVALAGLRRLWVQPVGR